MRLKVNSKRKKLKLVSNKKSKEVSKDFYDFTNDIKNLGKSYSGSYKGNFPYRPVIKNKKVIRTRKELLEFGKLFDKQPIFAYDTETNTLRVLSDNKDFSIVGISISWGEHNNYYLPIGHLRDEDVFNQLDVDDVVEVLGPIFSKKDITIIGHNLKFDMHVLKRVGIEIQTTKLFDTMLASWLCDENTPNGLKENALEKMGVSATHFADCTKTVPNAIKKQFGYKANSKVPFSLVLIEDGSPYAIDDAFNTWCLFLGYIEELIDENMDKIYYKKYIPFMITLYRMEERGMLVDVPKLKKMGEDMTKDLEELQYKIYELSGVEFNIGSSQQKAEMLFGWEKPHTLVDMNKAKLTDKVKSAYKNKDNNTLDSLGYVLERGRLYKKANRNYDIINMNFGFVPQSSTKSGNPSVDNKSIVQISKKSYTKNKRKQQGVEMCRLLVEYSKLSKLKTAFVDGILEQLYEDGKAHPHFNQIGTDSGRISASQPNLMQLPNADEEDTYQIRDVFIGSYNEKFGVNNDIISVD